MQILYQLVVALVFYLTLPLTLLYVLITGKHREGLRQRLGLYSGPPRTKGGVRIWLHAASVGEVQAAAVLMRELTSRLPAADFVITTMTIHGRKVAEQQFSGDIPCLLAPLDVPGIAQRVIKLLAADIYLCLETELWPVLLYQLREHSIPVVLVNGRMSLSTASRYQRHSWLFSGVLANFSHLCLISDDDRRRYAALGVDSERLEVMGNLKYDQPVCVKPLEIAGKYRQLLQLAQGEELFIAGSTHPGEEEILLAAFRQLATEGPLVWLVAPRHLQRLDQLYALFNAEGMQYQLLSALKQAEVRRHGIIIVDTFGELASLYSVGNYIFIGGSFGKRRGHNIMEPAYWDKAVLYGPSTADFQDAVNMLEEADAGFTVANSEQLVEAIRNFRNNPQEYIACCLRAGGVARSQRGVAARQANKVMEILIAKEQ